MLGRRRLCGLAAVGLLALGLNAPANAARVAPSGTDWPCWRGPNGDGTSNLKGIKKNWGAGLKKLWDVSALGEAGKSAAAWSAPSVKGNRLVVDAREGKNDLLFCFDADKGTPVWKKSFAAPGGGSWGKGPRATPCIDGDKIYTYSRGGMLNCWNLADGKKVWTQTTGQEPKWGHSSSPFILGNLVIVQGGKGTIVSAFNKTTGAPAWKGPGGAPSYAAVMKADVGGRTQLVVFAAKAVVGVDPASGRQLWSHPWKTSYDVNATTPAVANGVLFISSGYGSGCAALSLTGTGVKQIWRSKVIASHHSDPVIDKGAIYCYSGQSTSNKSLKCVDLQTGALKWDAGPAAGWGTLVAVDGHLLCLTNRGKLVLVQIRPDKFTKVAEFQAIKGNPVWTVPVVANGKVYVRFQNKLACYDLMK